MIVILICFHCIFQLTFTQNVSASVKETENRTVLSDKRVLQVPQARIIEGYDCAEDQYAYLVIFVLNEEVLCGGSLINQKWVLTAAHCCIAFSNKSFSDTVVWAGISTFNRGSKPDQSARIGKIYSHSSFSVLPLDHDICLVNLSKPIKQSKKVKYVKLVNEKKFAKMIKSKSCTNATVMGFGDQIPVPIPFTTQQKDHAKCANLALVERERCQGAFDFVQDSLICADDPTGIGRDTCQGDSGGPMFCQDYQIGIVSAGLGCGQAGYPGFYNRIDLYEDFIRDAQAGLLDDDSLKKYEVEDATERLYSAGVESSCNSNMFYCYIVCSLEMLLARGIFQT